MDNKPSELSKPVAYMTAEGVAITHLDFESGSWGMHNSAKKDDMWCPLYSQEYVSALLQRIASQDDHINQQQDRIDSLERTNSGLGQRLGAAEKRLATPVRFPDCDVEAVSIMAHWLSDEEVNAWVKGIEFSKQQIRAAGFTVSEE